MRSVAPSAEPDPEAIPAQKIPAARERRQSALLAAGVTSLLAASCLQWLLILRFDLWLLTWLGIALTFAVLVWALRAATPAAAGAGAMVCLLVGIGTGRADRGPLHSGLAPLIALFVLTFGATRAGRARKQALRLAEPSRGRSISQVVANLGVAGIVASGFASILVDRLGPRARNYGASTWQGPVLLLAALAEATADTVSSEIGQAFGGRPLLITTLRRVPRGSDGGITLLGTAAGSAAALAVVAVGGAALELNLRHAAAALGGGLAGLLFDSLLGATVERRGWLGNDLVNFASTLFAVAVALALLFLVAGS